MADPSPRRRSPPFAKTAKDRPPGMSRDITATETGSHAFFAAQDKAAPLQVFRRTYSWACSACGGWGRRGPLLALLAGEGWWGLTQLVAHQRVAYFLISHILTQPLWA